MSEDRLLREILCSKKNLRRKSDPVSDFRVGRSQGYRERDDSCPPVNGLNPPLGILQYAACTPSYQHWEVSWGPWAFSLGSGSRWLDFSESALLQTWERPSSFRFSSPDPGDGIGEKHSPHGLQTHRKKQPTAR